MDDEKRKEMAGYLGRILQGKVVEWVEPNDSGGFTLRFMDGDALTINGDFSLKRHPPFKVEMPEETVQRLKGSREP